MRERGNGEITSEPISVIVAGDNATCTIYVKTNIVLNHDRWKQFNCKSMKKSIVW